MLKMGCAKADVTPSWPTYIRGYASRNRLTDAIEEPLEVGVIALEQNDQRSLIITVDMVGIEYPDTLKIYKAIADRTGIDYPNIMLSASHTHFAPSFNGYSVFFRDGELPQGEYPADTKYFDFWLSKLLPAVDHALADLEAVSLLQADIPVSNVAFNRRTVRKEDGKVTTNFMYPLDPEKYEFSEIDTVMHVWKFMRSNNSPKGILARFGCHPVTGGYEFYAVSSDYPGYFKQYVQEKMGCPGFFMLGTAGDVVPLLRNGESRKDIGEVLASSIRLAGRTFRDTTDFTIKSASAPITLYSDQLKGKSLADLTAVWEKELAAAKENAEYTREFYKSAMLYGMYKEFNGPEANVAVQLMQLGDRVLVGLPFEVLTVIGKNIRAEFPNAAVVSCTAGYECYLPIAEDFPKGGYEADDGTIWNPDTGERVVNTAIEALKKF